MLSLTDSLAADDPINREVWDLSRKMQKEISRRHGDLYGAQQAMPKPGDKHLFGPENPLPWVPDLTGSKFGSNDGVLVVGSSYNGFIHGYSARGRTMRLQDYVACRDDEAAGLNQFMHEYVRSVVKDDKDYYQPILTYLLREAEVPTERVCMTDLCKASFVKQGDGWPGNCRCDIGRDSIVKEHWADWEDYVCWPPNASASERIPYSWIWRRMLQCRIILALGSVAEYGILKIFREMADHPQAYSHRNAKIKPNSLYPGKSWKYAYACNSRKLRDWLRSEDWWKLEASENGQTRRWSLLAIYHPAAACGRNCDNLYSQTVPLVKRMIRESP